MVESQKMEPNSYLYIVSNMTSIINPNIKQDMKYALDPTEELNMLKLKYKNATRETHYVKRHGESKQTVHDLDQHIRTT